MRLDHLFFLAELHADRHPLENVSVVGTLCDFFEPEHDIVFDEHPIIFVVALDAGTVLVITADEVHLINVDTVVIDVLISDHYSSLDAPVFISVNLQFLRSQNCDI